MLSTSSRKFRARAANILAVALLGAVAPSLCAQTAAPAMGPAHGSLVIAGGGSLADTGILEKFLELAGGPAAPIIVVPTADGQQSYAADWEGLALLRAAGATNITILHTYDRSVADSESFVEPLRAARGVWFSGGRQYRLADAYLGTRTETEMDALLARGGVIGGSSAGASIQASFLVRGAKEGNHIVMSAEYETGFGFLQNAAVDQHLIVRNRERDLLQVLAVHPDLLGIGIDEGTAIVVRGNTFEVIGRSRVAVYDGTDKASNVGYFFLGAGQHYDMMGRSTTD
jgi:cyanophycinase